MDGGINTYAYVEGNPINLVDPKGLQSEALLPSCALGGPYNPVCDFAVIATACKWMIMVGGVVLMTQDTGVCDTGRCDQAAANDDAPPLIGDNQPSPPGKCQAWKQEVLARIESYETLYYVTEAVNLLLTINDDIRAYNASCGLASGRVDLLFPVLQSKRASYERGQ